MEPRVEEWDLVVKVKYGDTLRRFSAYVHGQSMDHDMNKLRLKIIDLFNFRSDADLILTYTDEDGDAITLVNDYELRDAVIMQHLDPLRVTVRLNGSTESRSQTESLNAIAHSSRTGSQPPLVSSAVDEALKSVPEPLRTSLSKLSNDFVTKAAQSAPALAEFVEYFSKLGLSHVGQPSNVLYGTSLGTSSGMPSQLVDPNASPLVSVPTMPLNSDSVGSKVENNLSPAKSGNMTFSVETSIPPSTDLHQDISSNPRGSEFPTIDELMNSMCTTKGYDVPDKGDSDSHNAKSIAIPCQFTQVSNPPADQTMDPNQQNFELCKPVPKSYTGTAYSLDTDNYKHFPSSTAASASQIGSIPRAGDHINRRSGVPVSDFGSPSVFCPFGPYRRETSHYDSMHRTFHRGVRCDGCGMHPIMGPRFSSNVKEDYDLCSICFSEIGNTTDYTRIDRAPYRSPRSFKEFYNPHKFQMPLSHSFRGCGMRPPRAKLESRFIQDVTVTDGTMMAPSTPFTKIWRMRNNGTTIWPSGTQLLWIGGDHFSDRGSVELEISVNGCLVDEEIDVAVDFRAPSRPGRYISYWRLASPSGQKFGQRVWVLIQVDSSRPNSAASNGFHVKLDLNLPPGSNSSSSEKSELGAIDLNNAYEPQDSIDQTLDEFIKPLAHETPSESMNAALEVDDTLCVGSGSEPPPPTPELLEPSPVSYPASVTAWPAASSSDALPVQLPSTEEDAVVDENPVEQKLLKELEEMGFMEIDLNKELLRMNEYNLEQCLDHLCGVADWDPILEELREMGFSDKEMNKQLLIKNGGSLKRVVLDLIAGEKA